MKAAIFDMDGTILDSMGMWRHLASDILKSMNIAPDETVLAATRSMGLYEAAGHIAQHYGLPYTAQEICQKFDDTALYAYQNTILPKPGAAQYLSALKQRGVGLAVATLSSHKLAEQALSRHGLDVLFDHILTVEDVGGVKKDRPDLFFYAAEQLGAAVGDCVVFEDSLYAIQTAVNAGFFTCGIADDHAMHKGQIQALCHRYIESWYELLDEQSRDIPIIKQPV